MRPQIEPGRRRTRCRALSSEEWLHALRHRTTVVYRLDSAVALKDIYEVEDGEKLSETRT